MSLWVTTTKAREPRACAPQQQKPLQKEPQPPQQSSLRLLQPEEAQVWQQRLSETKKKLNQPTLQQFCMKKNFQVDLFVGLCQQHPTFPQISS